MSPTLNFVCVFPTPELHSGATPLFRLRRNCPDTQYLSPVQRDFFKNHTLKKGRRPFRGVAPYWAPAKCGEKPRRKKSTSKMLHIPHCIGLLRKGLAAGGAKKSPAFGKRGYQITLKSQQNLALNRLREYMVFLFPRLSAASLPRRRMTARRAIAKHIAKIQPLPHPTKFPQGINIEFVKLNT